MGYMVNLVMEGKAAVTVGGGEVAGRKVEDLLAAKATVTVVALEACGRIAALADDGRIELRRRAYETGDLEGAFAAIAATNDEALNARIARDAMALKVLVNVVDRPALCTFTVPATVSRGDLTLAIATEGRCPALSGILRQELEGRYGPEYAVLVNLFAGLRQNMMALSWGSDRIREALSRLYRDGVMQPIATGDREALRLFLRERLGAEFPL